jgi:hypothetical protein
MVSKEEVRGGGGDCEGMPRAYGGAYGGAYGLPVVVPMGVRGVLILGRGARAGACAGFLFLCRRAGRACNWPHMALGLGEV